MVRKIGILTSGGDAPGMNAAIRAVTRVALSNGIEVVGVRDGYRGLLDENFETMTRSSVSDILDRGGTKLGSARLPEFKEDEVQERCVATMKKSGIDALVVIGGDGSYRGALALTQRGINCIGLPGTIDNDIPGTDFTIGFDTALHTCVECVDKLRDTSSSHHRASVVEVMGNHCGDLALYTAISCGAEMVITPETGYDELEVLEKLRYLGEAVHKNHAIIIISEKITDVDALAKKISQNTGFSGRATVLGHIQRGGSPTPKDRMLASMMGEKAVDLLMEGIGGQCVGIIDNCITSMPINEALERPRQSRKRLYRLFDRLV
ncbi:6-phosphofructokinase [Erysipelotrichaceae bacterium Oil+RF-744-GAM-WT-6]|jgi:6-phosphofructokinase 1|uniref:ATP-dependent 6-phosphofructokinase n=1 Tax=Stecheria intestinalis TaxID=2606630 RepID=A0A7X2NSP7_9FIRM|nr:MULTISPECIES: 6-phosphofructokinase [Erysipelotrichaceae]MCI2154154.1 6-phosphofructokinase [Solobacterium sp.]MDY4682591.1 6-phosphofructokinase [Lachnospiraceae bacterium]MCI6746224.1 6-phosphofructokinase [Anaerolactibacter massiliensis]MDD5881153.1 6-phosphofructokinase [Stecheria intestinalis]MDD6366483.1 6-phosphofructokinase [Stecheria intestinalis]